jgi:hypothetical protein
MPLSATGKTLWLLVLGAVLVVFLILPLRFTPVVPQSISALSIQARAQLVQFYEPPALTILAQTDSIRRDLVRRYGGVKPSQDSLLAEHRRVAERMLTIIAHLRDPRKATFDEQRQDISKLLLQLRDQALQIDQQLRAAPGK